MAVSQLHGSFSPFFNKILFANNIIKIKTDNLIAISCSFESFDYSTEHDLVFLNLFWLADFNPLFS